MRITFGKLALCHRCRGSGRVRKDKQDVPCPACNGDGYILLPGLFLEPRP